MPAATSSPVAVGGLSNGVTNQVKLRAVNAAGAGAASDAVAVVPRVPGAPSGVVGVAGIRGWRCRGLRRCLMVGRRCPGMW